MKAARIQRFGPANLITIDDLPRPEVGAGELLVRVKAAGLVIGMLSSERAKLRARPYHSFSDPSFQESSKQSELERLGSRLVTKSTGQQMSFSRVDTQNVHCRPLDGWPESRKL